MTDHAAIRILDASLNRATEGLRVVEDYVRFALNDGHLTEQLKRLRHDLAAAGASLPLPERFAARDTQHDVGTAVTTVSEANRTDAWHVCVASLERTKQSLRSLEEYSKVTAPQVADEFEALRYRLYTLEAAIGRTADAIQRLGAIRLYVLLDGRGSESAFAELVEELIAVGVDAIQLRDKRLSDRDLVSRARLLVATAKTRQENRATSPDLARSGLAPLVIINDRPDVAAAVDADGVHLGQDDLSVKDVRVIVGPRKLIGVSTHSVEQARAAVLAGANYLGVGPTFPSRTKEFEAFTGLPFIHEVAAEIRLPAFAIGGITAKNLPEILAAGLCRVAVSSAVTEAPSPREAAAELKILLDSNAGKAGTAAAASPVASNHAERI